MECKVLRENIALEVSFTMEGGTSTKTVISSKINFNDTITLQVKHLKFCLTNYNNYNSQQAKYQNIVLISLQEVDKNDKSTHKIRLSCPEFNIQNSIFYSDDNHWHIVNENTNALEYKFTITLQLETLSQVKFSVLYEDEQITDFKLKAQDGDIDIHKAFLAIVSPFFRLKILDSNENVDSLDVPETSVKILRDFKKCIYTEVLPDQNLEELLLLATYFKIKWLEYKCVDKIMQGMSSGDAINLLEFALKYKHIPLFLGIMDHVQSGGIKMSQIRKHYIQQ